MVFRHVPKSLNSFTLLIYCGTHSSMYTASVLRNNRLFPENGEFFRKYYIDNTNVAEDFPFQKSSDTLLNQHSNLFPFSPASIYSTEHGNYITANKNRILTAANNETSGNRTAPEAPVDGANQVFAVNHFITFLVLFITCSTHHQKPRESVVNHSPGLAFIESFTIPKFTEDPSLVIFYAFDFTSFEAYREFIKIHMKTLPYNCHIFIYHQNQLYFSQLVQNDGVCAKADFRLDRNLLKNKNLARTTLFIFAAPLVKHCLEVSHQPSYYYNSCVIKTIREQLNVTLNFTTPQVLAETPTVPGELPPPVDLGINIILGLELNEEFHFNRSSSIQPLDRWLITNPSIQSFPYSYITIGNRLANGMTAITKPYQYETWIGVFVTGTLFPVFITVILYLHTKIKPTIYPSRINLLNFAFISFAGAMSQCDEHSSRVLTNSRLVGCLWLLWNFASIVILNAYDGQFYSFLASESELTPQASLLDLVNSDKIPYIITFNYIWRTVKNNSKLQRQSGFKDLILKEIIDSGQYPSYYLKLYEKVGTHFLLNAENSTAKVMVDIIHKKGQFTNNTFGLIDFEETIGLFRNLISHLDKRTASRVGTAQNFVMRYMSIVRRSYFAPLIQRVFSGLLESGLMGLWKESHQRDLGKEALRVLNEWQQQGLYRLRRGSLLTYRYGSAERDDIRDFTAEPTPIPWALIKSLVQFALILLSAALLVFALEMVSSWRVYLLFVNKKKIKVINEVKNN